ncbi:hypothetical protein TNCV_511841 [Trichonephila clavipes]|nr:hypothetical protein TNCV_511841 [Trichonephila clavipes]
MTVSRISNRCVQVGDTELHAESQWSLITDNRQDRFVTHMAIMDRAAPSRGLSQELRSFARRQMSARTVRRHLKQHGL